MNLRNLNLFISGLFLLAACIPSGGPSGDTTAGSGGGGSTTPHHMVLVAGDLQSAMVGTAVAVKPKIKIVSSSGTGVAGITISFTVTMGGGSVGTASVITDAGGFAETTYTLGPVAGANQLTASSPITVLPGTPTTIVFSELGTTGVATKLSFSPQPSGTATAGVNLTTQPGVAVLDGFNNVVTSSTASVTLAAYIDAGCTIASTGTFSATTNPLSATSGMALFAGVKHTKAESIYIKATSAGLTSACSSVVVVSPNSATKLVYTTQPSAVATADANLATQPVTAIQDTYNNTITSNNASTVTLAPYTDSLCTVTSTGSLTATANPKTVSSGVAAFAAVKHSKAETIYIGATSGAFTTCSTAVVVSPAAASKLAFSTQPSSTVVAGVDLAVQPVVQVQDAGGNVITSDNTTAVTIAAFTDASCTVASTGTFNVTTNPETAASGVVTFAGVNHEKAEVFYIQASAGGLTSACSSSITVSPAAASKLVYSTQPSTPEVSDTVFGTQPVLQVQDPFGNVIVLDSSTAITLAPFTNALCTAASSGTLSATTNPLTVGSGVATFAGVKHSKSETLYIQASAAGLTPACSNSVVITAGSATQLAFTTQPSGTATAGADLGTQPIVEVQDALGNVVPTDSSTSVTIAAFTDAACTVASTGTFNASTNPVTVAAGVASFANVNHEKAETIYLKATAGGLTSDCSTATVVSPNSPNKIVFSTQPSTPEVADTVFGTQPVVQIQDVYNNIIVSDSTSTVTLAPYTNVGCTVASTGTLSATTNPVTVSSGVAAFAGVKHSKSETVYIKATSGAFTACSSAVVIGAGVATKLVFTTEPSATATAGANFAIQPVVAIQDAQNNVVVSDSSSAVTIAAYTDSGCTVASTGTLSATSNPQTAASGVATFAGVKHSKSETIYLKASSGALTTDCSTLTVVSPGAATEVIFATQPSATVVAGVNLATQPVVHIRDASGNVVVSDSSSTVTLAAYTNALCTVASTGTFNVTTNPETAAAGIVTFAGVNHEKAETLYIKATSGALTSACSTLVTVSPAAASKVVFSTQPSNTGTANTNLATQPAVQVQDAFSNVVLSDNSTSITLAPYTNALCTVASSGTLSATTNPLTASSGLSTFAGVKHSKSETLYIQAFAAGLTPACSNSISIAPGAATQVVFTTQPSGTGTAGSNLATQPVAAVQDAIGNTVASDSLSQITLAAFTDSGCTVASTGTFSATTNPLTVSSGVATFAGVNHTKAETIYIKASSGALTTACSSAVVISHATANKVIFATQPSSTAVANTNFTTQPVVEVQDTYNNVITSDSASAVTLAAFTDSGCTVASTGTFSATTNPLTVASGIATFAGAKHTKSEVIYLKATNGALNTACSSSVTVSAGVAAKVVFSTQPPGTATAGSNFSTQPVVQVQDAQSNIVVTDNTSAITLAAFTDSGCTVASTGTFSATTNPLTASAGVATFAGVKHSKSETIYVKASSGALTTDCSTLVVVSPGAATEVIFSTQPASTGTAGVNLTTQPVVQVRDAAGNVVAADNSSQVTLAAYTNAGCTVASTGTFSATTNPLTVTAGVATFAGVNHTKAEALYIKASSGALTTACSTLSTISPAAASKLVFSTEPSTTATANTNFATQPVVQVQDAYSNVLVADNTTSITLAPYTNSICTAASSGTLSATTNPLSASSGVATFAGVNHSKAETLYVQAASGGLTPACSTLVTVSAGAATKVVFSTQPAATGTAGTNLSTQPVVQVQDAQSNVVVTDSTSAVTIAAYTDSGCTVASTATIGATTNPLTVTAGVATFAGVNHTKAETLYIKATSGALTTACSTLSTISPAAASKVVFSTQPSTTATANTNFVTQPVVQVQDTYDNVITSDSASSVTLAPFTNAGCTVASTGTLSATTNPLTVTSGVATFAGVKHDKAETLYIKATNGALTSACSTLVTVSAGAATKVVFSTQPSTTATAGTNFATQPVIQVQDASSNVVASDNSSAVTIASYTDSGCTVASTSAIVATTNPLTVASGVATFAGVKHNKAETLYIKATSGALTTACSTLVTVSPGAATKVIFSTQPSATGTAGTNLSTQPVVQVQDAGGNVVVSDNSSAVTLASYTDSGCTVASSSSILATTNPLTVTSGVATFAGVKHNKAETLYIKASSGALTTACSTLTTISHATATKVVFSTQPSTTATVNTNFTTQPVVQVQDTYNNVVTSDSASSVTLASYTDSGCTVASSSAILATTNPLTVSSGVATFAGVKHNKAETLYIKATDGALTTACSTLVTVSPGAASKLIFSTQPSATGTAGTNLATQPVVQVQDAQNNVVTSDNTSAVTLASYTDSGCTVASTSSILATTNPLTVTSGVATFAGVKHTKAETLYIKATSGALTTACSTLSTISPAAASKVVFSTQPSTTANSGAVFATQPVVQVQDTYDNVITSDSSSQVTLASYTNAGCTVASTSAIVATTNPLTVSAGVATFAGVKHNKAETLYIKATDGALTSACSTLVTVSAGAATQLVFSTQPASTATAGVNLTTQPVVQIQDAAGNVVSSDNASAVTIAAYTNAACTVASTSSIQATTNPLTVSSGVATFAGVKHTKAETLYIKATSGALTSACSTLTTVTFNTAAKVAFSTQPATTATAGVNLTTQPVVQVQDTYGNVITSSSAAVTLAAYTNAACTTTSSGTFSATTNPVTSVSGVATFAGVNHTKAETLYIRASSGVLTTACSTLVTVGADVPDDASSTITTNPASGVVADNTDSSALTVTLIDQYGNPCAGVTVNVASDGTGDTITQPGVTDSSGIATGSIVSTVAESKGISITLPTGLTATDTVDFVAGPADPANSTIVASPSTGVSSNGTTTATVTITLLDQFNNPVVGASTTFASTGTGNTLVQPGSTTDASGVASGTIASTVAEIKTLSIATPSGLSGVTNTVEFIISPVSAANSDIQGSGPVVADGVATSTITITLKDASNLPVIGVTPVFSATNTGSSNIVGPCSASNGSGISTCTLASKTAEVKTLTMTAPITDTGGTVTFTRSLETSIELLDVGVISSATATTFARTRTTLDTTYYDGTITYVFEATCKNTETSNRTVSLIDSAGTSKASLTITASTANPTRFSTTWTPTAGANNYRVQTGAATGAGVTCYTARILVRQTGATKTRVYIPLIGADYDTASAVDTSAAAVDTRTNTTTYGQTTAARFAPFTYTAAEWGTLAATGWTFEGVQQTSTGSGARVRLYTTTGTNKATLPNSTTTISLASVSFASLTNGTSYEVRHRGNTSSASNRLYRAGLWANIANIQKGNVCYRIAKRNTFTATTTVDTARAEIDLTRFTNGTAYHEAHGADSVAGTSNIDVLTFGANDTGASGSTIGSSSIDYTSTTKTRTRTGALSITNGDRVGEKSTVTSGTQDVTQSCLLVIFN